VYDNRAFSQIIIAIPLIIRSGALVVGRNPA
jgi:hypothetical protein